MLGLAVSASTQAQTPSSYAVVRRRYELPPAAATAMSYHGACVLPWLRVVMTVSSSFLRCFCHGVCVVQERRDLSSSGSRRRRQLVAAADSSVYVRAELRQLRHYRTSRAEHVCRRERALISSYAFLLHVAYIELYSPPVCNFFLFLPNEHDSSSALIDPRLHAAAVGDPHIGRTRRSTMRFFVYRS